LSVFTAMLVNIPMSQIKCLYKQTNMQQKKRNWSIYYILPFKSPPFKPQYCLFWLSSVLKWLVTDAGNFTTLHIAVGASWTFILCSFLFSCLYYL
jgi:hypothetical protein